MFGFGFQQPSGRVISLGRFMLAALFLVAIWLDPSQPVQAAAETYALLGAYVLLALAVVVLTWSDWWLDARLAAPAHYLDVLMFTLLVFSTEGYTSPFFLFFVFVLLSAQIRWGWRETAMTAAAVIVLYLGAGLLVAASGTAEFELRRFIIRSGHLVILSGILIWFGINRRSGSRAPSEPAFQEAPDEAPLESALAGALHASGASKGVLLWRDSGRSKPLTLRAHAGKIIASPGAPRIIRFKTTHPLLYNLRRNRAVARKPSRRLLFAPAGGWLNTQAATAVGVRAGLAVRIQSDSGEGELFLEDIEALSLDHLELGNQLASDIVDHLRRHVLFRAVEDTGEARARLSLARDLHDSVVQFLAGAAFRIEALMRSAKSGQALHAELLELKRLMLQEQEDLRSFIGALRSGREMPTGQLAKELQELADKLGRQWNINCAFSAQTRDGMIPMRLHIDGQQLVREAVANAVRHGGATAVRIFLSTDEDYVHLVLEDNGKGFPTAGALPAGADDLHPGSLKERVQDAGGELTLATRDVGTSVSMTLPIRGRR